MMRTNHIRNTWMRFKQERIAIAALILLSALSLFAAAAPFFPYDPNTTFSFPNVRPPHPPSSVHWLGTDDRGHDLATRLAHGLRHSIFQGFLATLLVCTLGGLIGGVQGYFAGKIDTWLQKLTEVFAALPGFYLFLFAATVCRPGSILPLLIWMITGWYRFSPYIRTAFLQLRKQEFVIAARAAGSSDKEIFFRHLFPHTISRVLALLPSIFATAVIGFATFDFLGLGPAKPSLGELFSQAKDNLSAGWLVYIPIGVFAVLLICLAIIGEALARAANPKPMYREFKT